MNQVINKRDDENKEHFTVVNTNKNTILFSTYGILHFFAFLFALYLSFKCNGGFNVLHFLVAFFCPWIYIVYILATRKGICSGYIKGKPPIVID